MAAKKKEKKNLRKASVLQIKSAKAVDEVIGLIDKAEKILDTMDILLDPDNLTDLEQSLDRLNNTYKIFYGKVLYFRSSV